MMNVQRGRRFSSRRFFLTALVVGGALTLCIGCERGSEPSSRPASAARPADKPERRPPTLSFPTEIRAAYPEISAFLDEFLNAWLSTDYLGYRRLVSRAHTPESRERFELICEATDAVVVESIELVETRQYPAPTYCAVFHVELTPEAAERRHEEDRKIAILVFPELGEWRMAAAPTEFQPQKEIPPPDSQPTTDATTTSAPTSAPVYPWDEEGDY